MNTKEWVISKQKLDFKYCGRCYMTKDVHPFGFCRRCWEQADKPKKVKV
jgi:hypothetical protein